MEKRKVLISSLKHFEGLQTVRPVPKPTDKNWPAFVVKYCDSIEINGLLDWGFTCVERPDGLYITNGNRRITALKYNLELQRPNTMAAFPGGEIEVAVIQADEMEVLLKQTVGNNNSEKATPKQINRVIVQGLTMGKTLDDIALILGMTVTTVEKYAKLNLLPAEVVDSIEDGDICIANGIALTTLPRDVLDPENGEELSSWVEKAQTMKAEEFAAEAAKEITAARAARKGEGKKTQFSPEAKLRSREDLAKMFATAEQNYMANQEDTEARVRYNVMKEVFSLDEATQQVLKAQFDAALKAANEKAEGKKKSKEYDEALKGIDQLLAANLIDQVKADELKAEVKAKQENAAK